MTQRTWKLEPDQPRYTLEEHPIYGPYSFDNIRREWASHICMSPTKEQEFVDRANDWWDKACGRRAYAAPVKKATRKPLRQRRKPSETDGSGST